MSKQKQPFLARVAWLFSGLFLAQVINLIFAFILPRIYQPDQFAVFGIFLSTVLIFFEISNLKLDQALMLPKDMNESIYILSQALKSAFVISLLILIFWTLYVLSPYYQDTYRTLAWLPWSILLQGLIQPLLSFSNRMEHYKMINISKVGQALSTGLVSCIPFFLRDGSIYLVQGFVAGQLVAVIILIVGNYTYLKKIPSLPTFSLSSYLQFPRYGTWSSLLHSTSRNSVVYILNIFFTPQIVGLYTFTNRLVQAPLGLITSSIGQAYFREASLSTDKDAIRVLTHKIQKILMQLALIPIVLALFAGPEIFSFLFGEEWREAGHIARYLSLWYGTTLVVTPLSMLIDARKKLKWELGYHIVFIFIRISLLIFSSYYLSFAWVMIIFCGVSVFFNLYLLLYINKLARHGN